MQKEPIQEMLFGDRSWILKTLRGNRLKKYSDISIESCRLLGF